MKKNTYLTILTLVTVVCIIIGIGIRVIKAGNWLKYTFNNSSITTDKSGVLKLDDFDSIEISADIANIDVSSGDDFTLEYKIGSNAKIEYSVDNGKLNIKQSVVQKVFNNNTDYSITVTVPKDKVLQNINIDANVGDIDVDEVNAINTTISADVGEIDLDLATFETVEIEANVGDVSVNSKEDLSTTSIEVTNDIGEVSINRKKQGKDYHQSGNDSKSIEISANIGDVSLNY